ncbi:hypothetical protein DXB65_08765 [Bacteroides oleiciplenus]|uniref:Uncharacterized protein n=1 Tax=Bacteroides oleiciplenus TaxID=626931 RepID=A0A3E5BGE3_9BACE|nr:hypothetical protein DXB65_08765 [Bacteroides oleiciplenus]
MTSVFQKTTPFNQFGGRWEVWGGKEEKRWEDYRGDKVVVLYITMITNTILLLLVQNCFGINRYNPRISLFG